MMYRDFALTVLIGLKVLFLVGILITYRSEVSESLGLNVFGYPSDVVSLSRTAQTFSVDATGSAATGPPAPVHAYIKLMRMFDYVQNRLARYRALDQRERAAAAAILLEVIRADRKHLQEDARIDLSSLPAAPSVDIERYQGQKAARQVLDDFIARISEARKPTDLQMANLKTQKARLAEKLGSARKKLDEYSVKMAQLETLLEQALDGQAELREEVHQQRDDIDSVDFGSGLDTSDIDGTKTVAVSGGHREDQQAPFGSLLRAGATVVIAEDDDPERLAVGGRYRSHIGAADTDRFFLDTNAGHEYDISVQAVGGTDPVVRLVDPDNGAIIAVDDDSGEGLGCRLVIASRANARAVFLITSHGNDVDNAGTYILQATTSRASSD